MALTRNESAVHEKIGVYDKVVTGDQTAMVLGAEIDLRIFPENGRMALPSKSAMATPFAAACSSSTRQARPCTRSICVPPPTLPPSRELVGRLEAADQSPTIDIRHDLPASDPSQAMMRSVGELRRRWSRLTDTHQFFGMLKTLKVGRLLPCARWAPTMPGRRAATRWRR